MVRYQYYLFCGNTMSWFFRELSCCIFYYRRTDCSDFFWRLPFYKRTVLIFNYYLRAKVENQLLAIKTAD